MKRPRHRSCLRFPSGLIVVVLGACAMRASAQGPQHAGHPLGTVTFPITCSPQAQAEFDRAVALLHHMTYPQAREEFERVARTDPRCAMALGHCQRGCCSWRWAG